MIQGYPGFNAKLQAIINKLVIKINATEVNIPGACRKYTAP